MLMLLPGGDAPTDDAPTRVVSNATDRNIILCVRLMDPDAMIMEPDGHRVTDEMSWTKSPSCPMLPTRPLVPKAVVFSELAPLCFSPVRSYLVRTDLSRSMYSYKHH